MWRLRVDKVRAAQVLLLVLMVGSFSLLVPIFEPIRFVQQAFWLKDHGELAYGTVVDGKTCGYESDCIEDIEFKDERGKLRRTARFSHTDPEIGASRAVHYAPDDPNKAYVVGDTPFGG